LKKLPNRDISLLREKRREANRPFPRLRNFEVYRYKTYMERARCMERHLGLCLYQYSFDYFGSKKIPGQWAGNKKLWASVPCLTFLLYAVLLLRDGPKLTAYILK
jgi:hypothetical protein